MLLKNLNNLIPFKSIFRMLLVLSFFVQITIISYNHLSGYYTISTWIEYFSRIMFSTIISFVASLVMCYLDMLLIWLLNMRLSWNSNSKNRIVFQFIGSLLVSIFVSVSVTLFANSLNRYSDALIDVVIVNALITAVINIILLVILEAWIFYRERALTEQRAIKLEEEITKIKFEILKNQINPHFLFNSLNTLSVLIKRDSAKAQQFIEEFSKIYRYVLETIEKPLVSLGDELDFCYSYFFLQKIRFGDKILFTVDISTEFIHNMLPPLSLQLVIENVLKHNQSSESSPLEIKIYTSNNYLVVENVIAKKSFAPRTSTGTGQNNLTKRYKIVSNLTPEFMVKNERYIAKLPLIKV